MPHPRPNSHALHLMPGAFFGIVPCQLEGKTLCLVDFPALWPHLTYLE